jgi:membrane protein required for colicin V production
MRFNWLDALVALFVIRGMVIGHRRGLSGELIRFLGIVCALYLSFKFYEPGADRLMQRVSLERNVAIGFSFAGIFIAVALFFYMVGQTARRAVQLPAIAAFDKLGGAIIGGAKAFLVACVALILLALVRVDAISNAVSQNSFCGPLAISAVPGAYRLAARVYPPVQSLPAREVIQKLPGVRQRTEMDFGPGSQDERKNPGTADEGSKTPHTKGKTI